MGLQFFQTPLSLAKFGAQMLSVLHTSGSRFSIFPDHAVQSNWAWTSCLTPYALRTTESIQSSASISAFYTVCSRISTNSYNTLDPWEAWITWNSWGSWITGVTSIPCVVQNKASLVINKTIYLNVYSLCRTKQNKHNVHNSS